MAAKKTVARAAMQPSLAGVSEFLEDRRIGLEEAFFRKQEAGLLEKMKQEQARKDAIEGMMASSGIQNRALLGVLAEKGLKADTLSALRLIPLLEVAWADRVLDVKERKAILDASKEANLSEEGRALLQIWLEEKPDANFFKTWYEYISELKKQLEPSELSELRETIVALADRVARSAGGVLGLSSISAAEETILDRIAAALS